MVSAVLIQQKIAAGNAKAAARLGDSYQQYRASSAASPIVAGNLIQSLMAQFAADKAGKFASPSQYGKAGWVGIFDMSQVMPGDYLVGLLGTFFVCDVERFTSPMCVLTNRTVTVTRMENAFAPGANSSYGGDVAGAGTAIITSWPASVLIESTKTTPGVVQTPNASKLGAVQILLPASVNNAAGSGFLANDIVTDDLGNRYAVYSAEQSNLGWRLNAETWAV